MAAFAPPYLVSGQSLAVDTERFPTVRSVDDLAGLTIGVQQGNTSQPIAERLVAHGKAKAVRVYRYGDIRTALTDLTTGGCDAFMKLAPVLTELVGPVAGVEVVQRNLSRENIAIAVAAGAERAAAADGDGASRTRGRRHTAGSPAQVARQSLHRPEPGRPLTSLRTETLAPLGWFRAIHRNPEIEGEQTSDGSGRR